MSDLVSPNELIDRNISKALLTFIGVLFGYSAGQGGASFPIALMVTALILAPISWVMLGVHVINNYHIIKEEDNGSLIKAIMYESLNLLIASLGGAALYVYIYIKTRDK